MSHEFETGFFVKEPAWHNLGVVLENAPQTSQEAIVQAGLDWDVNMVDVQVQNKTVDGYKAIVRSTDGEVYGIATPKYVPLQNRDSFAFFDPIVKSGAAAYETAGSLFRGKKVWVLAKLNRPNLAVTKGDEIQCYLTLVNCHDGRHGSQVLITPVRVVCNNTLQMAVNGAKDQENVKRRLIHSSKTIQNLEQIRDTLDFVNQKFDNGLLDYKKMLDVTVKDAEKYFKSVLKLEGVINKTRGGKVVENKTLSKIMNIYQNHPTNNVNGIGGSLWAAYNAVTFFVDHERGRKDEDVKLNNVWFGTGQAIKQRAFDNAMDLIAA